MQELNVKSLCFLGFLAFGGCALGVKNVKPSVPYDFGQLDQLAKYAQAAYANDLTIHAICQPAFNDVHIQTIPSTNNKYFVATSSSARLQVIAIAGTANIENALLDADLTQEYIPELKISLHRGFARAAWLIYEDVRPHLIAGHRVLITGHSLGGAEAVIIGMLLQAAAIPVEKIVTYGQPKVSNQAGVDAFSILPLIRVVNQNDIIPELPLDPYRHIGPELVLFPGQAIQNHQAPSELPDHYIANYLVHLDSKVVSNQVIPYPK